MQVECVIPSRASAGKCRSVEALDDQLNVSLAPRTLSWRPATQLFTALAFDFLCNVPDHEEVGNFAEAAGLCVASQVESHFRNVQEYRDLLGFDVFQQDPPNALTGKSGGAPSWLLAGMTVRDVAEAVRSKEYNLAWRRLNSAMPDCSETIELVDELAPHAENPEFGNLVQCWRQYNWSS